MDALYGTDALPEDGGAKRGKEYNPVRGQKVFEKTHEFLDEFFSLAGGAKYQDVSGFLVKDGKLVVLIGKKEVSLKDSSQFVGYTASPEPTSVLLRQNDMHFEIKVDRFSTVGKTHPAGIEDVVVESAMSAIADCEDSVAAVDAEDKANVYGVWAGLMKGTLQADMGGGKVRKMNPDRTWTKPGGGEVTLPGRVVLLVRNVGLHVYTNAVTTQDGSAIPENMLDLAVTSLAAMHDLQKSSGPRNSRTGSMYIVRPKMHGPEEVAFANHLFGQVEDLLGLKRNTLKMGIMDEERRTSVNLFEAMREAKDRVVFINTGFLDRTGDEIHTSFLAGPFLPKGEIKQQKWIQAYEDNNVDCGLVTELTGKGQIGKGMWAAPDNMKQMLKEKIGHPMSGANTAWVPSPTAATLHALHYHRCNVFTRQAELRGRPRANVEDILTVPLLNRKLNPDEVRAELKNNAQGLLGYMVRWIQHGVGCSKVPDMNDVQLMEDRATLRISSQHIANWLHHKIITEEQVMTALREMAAVVDRQNAKDPNYKPMAPHCDGIEFCAAVEIILKGKETPNGLTEALLIDARRQYKAKLAETEKWKVEVKDVNQWVGGN
jgi:malate synthase